MKQENYITIQGWMVTDLGLSGNELLCYALIYGFSQDGESKFQGSSKYICNWLNISQPTALNILKKLCEKGLIEKIEKIVNGCHLCDYKIILDPLNKFKWGTKETLVGGTKETLVHNNSIDNNKEKYKKEFDEFWLIYPKQRAGSKEKAYKSFCKAIDEKRVTIEKIMESVKLYSKSDEVAKGFAKGCAAWLNDDRFNNFYKQEPKEEYKYWL